MSADKDLKAYIDRVLRLKEEQDALGQDIRDVYAEAKSEGYDKTVMGKLVAHLRKVLKEGDSAVSEQEDIFDTYLQAYRRASGMPVAIAHTHEEDYDRQTGEVFSQSPASNGEKAVRPEPAASSVGEIAATQSRAKASGEQTEGTTGLQAAGPRREMRVGEASAHLSATSEFMDVTDRRDDHLISPSEDGAIAAVNARDGLADANGVEPSSSAPVADQPLAGGSHVTAPVFAATHKVGASSSRTPATHPLRPNCLNPSNCAGYGSNHCHACKVAMREGEAA